MSDLISRQDTIDRINEYIEEYSEIDSDGNHSEKWCAMQEAKMTIENMPSAQPEKRTEKRAETHACDLISRQAAIDLTWKDPSYSDPLNVLTEVRDGIKALPSAQPEQRYTEEELRVFQHGISLSLLSKRSAQHWHYDEDTATEIKFLERLYEKVGADIRGEQDE